MLLPCSCLVPLERLEFSTLSHVSSSWRHAFREKAKAEAKERKVKVKAVSKQPRGFATTSRSSFPRTMKVRQFADRSTTPKAVHVGTASMLMCVMLCCLVAKLVEIQDIHADSTQALGWFVQRLQHVGGGSLLLPEPALAFDGIWVVVRPVLQCLQVRIVIVMKERNEVSKRGRECMGAGGGCGDSRRGGSYRRPR